MNKMQKISKIVMLALFAAAAVVAVVGLVAEKVTGASILLLGKTPLFCAGCLVVAALVAALLANLPKVLESVRKFVVSLKRNPQTIPLVVLLITYVVYSMNLTTMANTTALVQGRGMGLCQFVMMLFTLLALVCMLNAFPKRKKANIPMVIVMFVMFASCIYSAITYQKGIMAAITRAESPIDYVANPFVAEANNMLNVYIVMLVVTAALVVLLPVYSKLLRKIKTSIEVEDNGEMKQIEIED